MVTRRARAGIHLHSHRSRRRVREGSRQWKGGARSFAFDEPAVVDQWTPDGRFLIFRTHGKAVYAMPLSGDRKPRMLADTPYSEDEVHVSPDGRWVAFDSDESGRWEVYVATFPAFTSKRQISSGGGVQPQWRARQSRTVLPRVRTAR